VSNSDSSSNNDAVANVVVSNAAVANVSVSNFGVANVAFGTGAVANVLVVANPVNVANVAVAPNPVNIANAAAPPTPPTPPGQRRLHLRGGDRFAETVNPTARIGTTRSPVRESIKLFASKSIDHWYQQGVRAMIIELGKPDCGSVWKVNEVRAEQVFTAIQLEGRTFSHAATMKRLLHQLKHQYAAGKRGNILKRIITELHRSQYTWKDAVDNRIVLRPIDSATLIRHANKLINYISAQHPMTPQDVVNHGNVFIEQRLVLDGAYHRFSEFYEYELKTLVQQPAQGPVAAQPQQP